MGSSLHIENIDAGYGAVTVLSNVAVDVRDGETVVMLGTNGNGKSTLMRCITGEVVPTKGRITAEIDGVTHDLVGRATEAIVDLGICLCQRPPAVSEADRRGEPAARRVSQGGAAEKSLTISPIASTHSRVLPNASASSRVR